MARHFLFPWLWTVCSFHSLEAVTQRLVSLLVGSTVNSDISFSCGSPARDQLLLVLVPGSWSDGC